MAFIDFQASLRHEKRSPLSRYANTAVMLGKVTAEKTVNPTPATQLSRRIIALGKRDPGRQTFFWRGGSFNIELNKLRWAKIEHPNAPAEATLIIRHDKEFAERFTRSLLTDLCNVQLSTDRSSGLRYLVAAGNRQRLEELAKGTPPEDIHPTVLLDTYIPGTSLEFRSPGVVAGMGDPAALPLTITAHVEAQ